MTIDIQVQRTDDVFSKNDVLNMQPVEAHQAIVIAAVTWCLVGETVQTAHVVAAGCAIDEIRSKRPGYAVYLLAAHTAVQPDTRIVRYRKLWSSLAAAGLPSVGEDLCEAVLPAGDGLRSFGLRRLGERDIEQAVGILENERASLLAAIPEEHEPILRGAVERGWPAPEHHPSTGFLIDIVQAGGIALWTVRAFDDYEAGVAAVALPKVFQNI